ncbi:MAG TPA: HD-GYP domain-containing protein [Terriglobia bacterium]|nr:HD-GYP domain-containing protein [Terriglobia bacterium]
MKPATMRRARELNGEIWLIASMLAIAVLLNVLVASHQILLGFYALPTLFSAYYYGRRHATLTALCSVTLVVLAEYSNRKFFGVKAPRPGPEFWFDLMGWAGTLILTAYAMGTLYERKENHVRELRKSYHGILMILRHFISNDKYTENHSYRVSVYAAKFAEFLNLSPERIEDVRAAALLHDIGKLEISREILYKAARLSKDEYEEMKQHVNKGARLLEPVGGSLDRIIPIILAHHDKFDGSGYNPARGEKIPLESRIISVADVYDSLTSDRPYRRAMSPFEAKAAIVEGSGKDFDPKVVDAFLIAFSAQELEVPDVVV